jgi:putative transposase
LSYSEDLRERVVGFVREGGSKTEASERFSVSRAVIYIWLKSESQSPLKTGPKGPHKVDLGNLKQSVAERPDAYLDELAGELNVSAFAVAYGLKRLGISRKKNHALRGKNRSGTQQISAGSKDAESC